MCFPANPGKLNLHLLFLPKPFYFQKILSYDLIQKGLFSYEIFITNLLSPLVFTKSPQYLKLLFIMEGNALNILFYSI